MIDAAGERGELDAAGLRQRVARAVLGYLGADWPQDVAGAS